MAKLILSRLAIAIPVLFIMTILTFVLVSLIPGNAATAILGQDATPEKIAALTAELGLDKPLLVQYGDWLAGVFRGDLGTSLYTGEAVTRVLGQRLWPTLAIAGFATIVAGVAIGTNIPCQLELTFCGKPCSFSVGTVGRPGKRSAVVTASALI